MRPTRETRDSELAVAGIIGRKQTWPWNAGDATLAGPEAERKFCCSINDGSDGVAYEMAREYLARRVANPLQAVAKTRPLP